MSSHNPFLRMRDGVLMDPFAILGVPEDANRATIQRVARSREERLERGERIEALLPGEPNAAAAALADPLCRTVYAILHFGLDCAGDNS